jgi:hypothetical protein
MLVPALLIQTSMPPKAETAAFAQLSRLGRVGDVCRHRERAPAERLAVPYGLFEQCTAAGGQEHVGAASGKSVGGREPYAAGGAGDHHHGFA